MKFLPAEEAHELSKQSIEEPDPQVLLTLKEKIKVNIDKAILDGLTSTLFQLSRFDGDLFITHIKKELKDLGYSILISNASGSQKLIEVQW